MTAFLFTLATLATTIDVNPKFYSGLGHHHRKITTKSKLAQRYFDQGLAFQYGFNHDEAVKAFRAATVADPNCAIAYWAIANACGPNINLPFVDPDRAKRAWDAIKMAEKLSKTASPEEKDLIWAEGKRYSNPQPEDRSPLDKAYSDAMREVWHRHPTDGDIGALFAESLMDLRPWDLWSLDGKPRDITPEVLRTIDAVLKLDPNHPMALHEKIHALEASPNPEKALGAADRLRFLQPGLGHMVHMPSHIDIRVGHWNTAIAANARAIEEDRKYRMAAGKLDVYRGYITHNYHMLAFAAMMSGQGKLAIKTMDEGIAVIPPDWAKQWAPVTDYFFAMPLQTRIRFGKWDEVLAAKDFPEYFPIARAMRHASRAVAYAAKGDVNGAQSEAAEFETMRKAIPADASFGNNSATTILGLESQLVAGEILLAQGDLAQAARVLKKGVADEDQVKYNEPPDWIQPMRHTLGAVLEKAGRHQEAREVYLVDLKVHPNNGWALRGLASAYRAEGNMKMASKYERRFKQAWAKADVAIETSCLCVKK